MSTIPYTAVQTGIAPAPRWPWVMLFSRLVLFFLVQAIFAAGFYMAGSSSAWKASAAWWPLTVSLVNFICLYYLVMLFRGEGKRYWDVFKFDRAHWKSDLLVILGVLLISGPIAFLPNSVLSQALFGEAQAGNNLLLTPLPLWAAWASILLFPATQALTELPTYFAYVMPRLHRQTGNKILAVALPSLMLGIQHLAAPLLFDGRFIAWRMLMFVPFAFLVGIVLFWRPRLLPYLVVVHFLMDLATAVLFLTF